jgi:hypothetical protein
MTDRQLGCHATTLDRVGMPPFLHANVSRIGRTLLNARHEPFRQPIAQ